jgi:hypothetical protein
MAQVVAPAGWPPEVRPPGAQDWEGSAAPWLLDISPPELRSYTVLRRHPVVLARFAVVHTDAALEAARRALGEVRTSLRDVVAPETVEQAVQAWERGRPGRAGAARPAVPPSPVTRPGPPPSYGWVVSGR